MNADKHSDYFLWLSEQVYAYARATKYFPDDYETKMKILRLMFEIEYSEFMAELRGNDINRIKDALDLRTKYIQLTGDKISDPTCILEIVVALAYRFDFAINYDSSEKHIEDRFWEMMNNMNLLKGGNFYPTYAQNRLWRFVDRTYKPTGKGGLFPLRKPKQDQTEVEIWDQMNRYIIENYPL